VLSFIKKHKDKEAHMELAERIKKRMEEKGLTLADLARQTGVAKGYLWEILGSRAKRPSANTLYEIARVLGTSVADLLGRETSEQASPVQVAESLREFIDEEKLPEEDVRMLATINFRGNQPKTKDDWKFLYESIKRSTRG
jgi:transcriptional regulator with XRE-family HTH domain